MSHPRNRRERFVIGDTKGKRRAIGYWNGFLHEKQHGKFEEAQELLLGNTRKRRNTTKLCSCPMCGNQRKFYGRTFQEIKHRDSSLKDF